MEVLHMKERLHDFCVGGVSLTRDEVRDMLPVLEYLWKTHLFARQMKAYSLLMPDLYNKFCLEYEKITGTCFEIPEIQKGGEK